MVCRDFILPEPASYVSFFALFNLRNLLYLIVSKTAFLWNHHETQVDQKPLHRGAVGAPVLQLADVQAVEILTAAYSKTSPRSDAAGTFCHSIPQNSQKPLFKIVR